MAHRFDLCFKKRIQFLDNDDLLDSFAKLSDPLPGQRPYHAELQEGKLWEQFLRIQVGNTCGNESDRWIIDLDGVVREFLIGIGSQLADPLLHQHPSNSSM